MCYSAKVWQRIKDYYRRVGAQPDYAQHELLFARRLRDPGLRIVPGFAVNFENPASPAERRIKALIDEHRAREATRLETELFANRKRLADAERTLAGKETKKALNDRRIAGGKIEKIARKLDALRGGALDPGAGRIFPFTYAPLVIREGGENRLILARYHCRQAGQAASIDKKFPGLYNARRDSHGKYWKSTFAASHAIAVFDAFFENVDRGGRNVVLQFEPRPPNGGPPREMLVACLYAHAGTPGAADELWSFAAITDEPPPEVAAAGHDRCPINLKPENVDAWLSPQAHSAADLQAILGDAARPYYGHREMAA